MKMGFCISRYCFIMFGCMMGHFGWLRKYYRETSRNMLVPWMVWGIQGTYIQDSIQKAGTHLSFQTSFGFREVTLLQISFVRS